MNPLNTSPIHNPDKIESNIAKKAFWTGLGYWITYHIADAGLAHFLAMKTLTHGTGPFGYIGINLNGAQPLFGGGLPTMPFSDHKNRFFLYKDFEQISFSARHYCYLRTFSIRLDAVCSGMSNFGYPILYNKNLVRASMGAIAGALTPTLKFRYTPNEISKCVSSGIFTNSFFDLMTFETSKPISPNRLGITGSLIHGLNKDMLNRMSKYPKNVLFGITLLATAALVGNKTYRYSINE